MGVFDRVPDFGSRRLQLNSLKSEIIWLGTRHALQKTAMADLTLEIGDDVVQPASVVRDLGVLLDQELTLKQHVAKVTSGCFYQLRRLKQVRRYVDNNVMAQLVAAFVISRLDYSTATESSPAFHNARSRLFNESRMRLLDWSSVSDHLITQPRHYVNYIGCLLFPRAVQTMHSDACDCKQQGTSLPTGTCPANL